MPMQRNLYPFDWEARARKCKRRSGWRCEACGKPCLLPGEDWLDFVLRMHWTVGEAIAALDDNSRIRFGKEVRYQLGAAHPNHDPENDYAELRAWCAVCHCRYDLEQIARKRRLKRERDGQGVLFHLTQPEPAGQGEDPTRVQLPISVEGEPCS